MALVVCIIDDNAPLLDALALALGDEGFEVRCATTWEEAQDRLSMSPIDAVVTDLAMPPLAKAEMVERVRARCPAMAIIAMSGSADAGIGAIAFAKGANAFLPKPVTGKVIAAALRRIISVRSGAALV